MKQTWQNIHNAFQLNGVSYSKESLKKFAQSLIESEIDFEQDMGHFLLVWCSDNETVQVFTSGSTGIPKRITLQKKHMVNSALATGHFFDLQPTQTALLCLPASSIAGKMMLVRAMVLGLHLDYGIPSSQPLEHIKGPYDFCAMVPLQAQQSLEQLHCIKTLILGGAAVSFALEKKLRSMSIHIYETYGMTETITHIGLRQISPKNDDSFRLLPNISVRSDERACLVIQAPKISSEEIVTNDLVEITSKDQFKWLGRYDNIINSGGVKLYPEEIERKLSEILDCRFFVAGVPDTFLGHRLILIIEGSEKRASAIFEKTKEFGKLTKFEIPKKVFGIEAFAETLTGKIHRQKTLQQLG